jgi:hypothetical protein
MEIPAGGVLMACLIKHVQEIMIDTDWKSKLIQKVLYWSVVLFPKMLPVFENGMVGNHCCKRSVLCNGPVSSFGVQNIKYASIYHVLC